MRLSCSRHGYEEPLWNQDRRSFLRAHEHAFAFFKGVPRVVRHDNLKAAVVRACLYDPDVSEVYSAFARHWGFVPLPSRPYHPQENGIAENSGGYVKSNALKGRRFQSLEELKGFLQHWNRTIARVRIHGTTRKQVYAHFLEVDQPALQPLPTNRFELFEVGTRTVHVDGHVEVAAGYYSVPEMLLGVQVRVQWDEHLVRVFAGGQCVTIHPRVLPGQYSTKPEHRSRHRPARQQAYLATLLTKIEFIGSQASAWANAAIVERDVRAYRLLQGLVNLTRRHRREQVDWACGVALRNGSYRYQTLTRLLDQQPNAEPPSALTQQHDCIRPLTQTPLSHEQEVHPLNPELDRKLRSLRLSGMVQALPTRNQEAIHHSLAYVEFLELLVEDELNRRRDRLLARRLKQAGVAQLKTLESFDWSFNPTIPKPLILDLATARFVPEHGGLLLVGPPGTGKSHIALALTLAAIQAGYTARYRSAFDLAEDLAEAAATGTRKQLVQQLTRVDLLVIEDLGMRRLPGTAAEDILEVFTRRYEVGATVLTTNRPVEDWGQILGDNAAAGAILDRFLHHAEIVRITGRSYRMHDRQQHHKSPDQAGSEGR